MFTPLSSLITNAAQRANVLQGVAVSLALERVNATLGHALGEARASRARALYVKYRTLTISVSDASIAAMIGAHEKEIMQTLNDGCTRRLADRIQVILEQPKLED